MRLTFVSLAAGATLAIAACNWSLGDENGAPRWASVGHRCRSDAPATSLRTAARDSLPVDSDSMFPRGRSARLARAVPGGWGGFFLDNDVPTMYLTDTSRRSEAVAAINQRGFEGRILGPDVRVRRGRWDFAQLYDWWRYLNTRVGSKAIVSSGIDEAGNRILYGVTTKSGVREVEARLEALRVPCFLVAVQIQGTPVLASPGR